MAYAIFEADWTGTGNTFTSCMPRNWKDTRFQVIYTNDFPSATLQNILFEFVNDSTGEMNADNVNNFIVKFGVNQGIPYRIRIDSTILFSGVIDTPNKSARYECDVVKCPLKRIGGIDWFMDTAQAVTFRAIFDNGLYSPPPGDPGYNPSAKFFYKKIPYGLSFRDYEQGLILFIQEITLIQQVVKAAVDTSNDIGNVSSAYSTDVAQAGTSSTDAVQATVALAEQIVYDIVLVIALVGLTENLVNNTVGVTKYKYCMMVNDIINSGLYYINNILGATVPANLQFKSSIFGGTAYGGIYQNTCVIPKKIINPLAPVMSSFGLPVIEDFLSNLAKGGVLTTGNESVPGTIGPPKGYPDGDLKKFLNDIKMPFNGAIKVVGNLVELEEMHFWNNIASFQLPNVDKPGYNANWPQPNYFNWMDLAMNYIVRFQTDSTDEMTMKNYRGTTAMVNIQPNTIRNPFYLLTPPSKDIILPFSLAKRKVAYNAYEQVVYDVIATFCDYVNTVYIKPINAAITAINYILAIFGTKINPIPLMVASNIFDRIGWLECSGDTFEVPKIFIADPQSNDIVKIISDIVPSGVPQFYDAYGNPENAMSAAAMMGTPANNQFHGLNLATRGNQWLGFDEKTFPMCLSDFLNLINNTNVFKDANGNFGKFESLEWLMERDIAEKAKYWRNFIYDKTLIETLTTDGQ